MSPRRAPPPRPAADPSARRRTAVVAYARKRVAVGCCPRCSLCGSRCAPAPRPPEFARPPRAPMVPALTGAARRYHHHPMWELGIRACDLCLKSQLVSAQALYHDYGIDFTRHLNAIVERVYYAVVDRNEAQLLLHISHNPADFVRRLSSPPPYFWRPHLAAVFDLPAAEARQRHIRTVAAPRLSAAVRALYTRIVIGHQGRRFTEISSHLFYTEGSLEWNQGNHVIHLPMLPTPAFTLRAATARALLQRLFLAYQGRLVVTRTKDPPRTYGALKQYAAYSAAHPRPAHTPHAGHIHNGTDCARFRAWAGLLPAGAGPVWPQAVAY